MKISLTDVVQIVMAFGVTPVLLTIVLLYVARQCWQHFLTLDAAAFKASLSKQQETTLAELRKEHESTLAERRTELDRLLRRWEHRYAAVHQRRIDALLDLYSALVELRSAINPAMYGNEKEVAGRAVKVYVTCQRQCERAYIFMPDDLVEKHRDLLSLYGKTIAALKYKENPWDSPSAMRFVEDAPTLEKEIRQRYQQELGAFEDALRDGQEEASSAA